MSYDAHIATYERHLDLEINWLRYKLYEQSEDYRLLIALHRALSHLLPYNSTNPRVS